MKQTHQQTLGTIENICEEIESLNLNDRDAWASLLKRLPDLPDEPGSGPAADLVRGCRHGIEAIIAQKASSLFQMADAVVVALSAAGRVIAGDDETDAETAAAALTQALAAVKPAENKEPGLTLDDLASRLVLVEPEELPEVREILNMATRLLEDAACDASWRPLLMEAMDRIAEVADGKSQDPEAAWAEAGRLIEAASAQREEGLPEADRSSGSENDADSSKNASTEAEGGEDQNYMPADTDSELLGEFINEGLDLIAKAEDALLTLENDPQDMEAVGMVFRAFHTVKGTAAFMNLSLISELGHHAESLLSRVRDREILYAGGYADLSLKALDMIKDLIQAVQEALAGKPLHKPTGYDELMTVLSDPEAHGVSEEVQEEETPRLGDLLVAQGKATREAVEAAAEGPDAGPIGSRLVKTKAASLADVGQALRTQRDLKTRSGAATVESSIRVSTTRLDRLIDAVGELVIAHSMVAQDELVGDGRHHSLQKKVGHTSKIVRELQDLSMSLRMVPLKGTFSKMARLVRDLSKKVGKNVNFVTEGEDTEIDRNLVDVISDPLVHMVRNAVDHGIERPEAREAAGKPRTGQVKLAAYHSAGSVVVEIRDDGQGLDRDKVLAKARERGLITEATVPGERELFNLIFEPGFSTADQVTDVSGRGVGMDVVKRNIESLRGQVEIHSEKGKGSVFKMSLPLTLAIIDGMVVRVGAERYIIPTLSIIRSVKPGAGDLSTVLSEGEMLQLQGRLIPLYRLGRLFNVGQDNRDLQDALVVVVEDEGRQAGLIIDELIGRQQVVIKSLGETMRDIQGISGGAIMPNGRVGLILDVASLVKFANAEAGANSGRAVAAEAMASASQ